MIATHTKAALAAAKARGVKLGGGSPMRLENASRSFAATGCVFQRKAATDSNRWRAGFQLKAATAEVA